MITQRGWVWIGVLATLFVLLHRNFLWRSLLISLEDNDWSHALLIPEIGVYYLFQHRSRLMQLTSRVCWWGMPIMVLGMLAYAFSIYPVQNDMFQGYSMIIALFGLVLFVLGPKMMTVLWFPVFYLGFGVKVSQKLWEMIALKLQTIASVSSTALLNAIGLALDLEASVRGNTIDLYHHGVKLHPPMNVAEACSGLRMLMAFLALGVAMAFLMPRAWWQRLVMVLMTLPIAVAVNVGRVTALGLLHVYAPDYAKGDFHIFVGMLMLIPAAGLFLLLGWVLDKTIIVDPSAVRERGEPAPTSPLVYEPTEVDGPMITKGALFGGGVTLLACLLYMLLIVTRRPDLAVERIGGSEGMIQIVALIGMAAVLVLMWTGARRIWPGLIPSGNQMRPGAKRGMALSIAGGFLATAMLGQAGIIWANDAVMFKKDVPLRKSLDLLEHPTGRWSFLFQDKPLSKDVEDELGTKMYLNRTYIDNQLPDGARGKGAQVHIAYYTGTVDTVPHVPQQCFKAGGLQQVAGGGATLNLKGEGYQEDPAIPGAHPGRGYPRDLLHLLESGEERRPCECRLLLRRQRQVPAFAARGPQERLRYPGQVQLLLQGPGHGQRAGQGRGDKADLVAVVRVDARSHVMSARLGRRHRGPMARRSGARRGGCRRVRAHGRSSKYQVRHHPQYGTGRSGWWRCTFIERDISRYR